MSQTVVSQAKDVMLCFR